MREGSSETINLSISQRLKHMCESLHTQSGGTAASPSASAPIPNPAREAAGPPAGAKPIRHHPAHLPNIERHNQPVILFVTVCTKNRKPVLADARVHGVLESIWPLARQYLVGRYILMPDHVHLFCSPAVHEPENVQKWVAYWKRLVSIELSDLAPLWQRDCWDTQLRHAHHYADTWAYVRANPVRKNLVSHEDDWPYQGCLNELRW